MFRRIANYLSRHWILSVLAAILLIVVISFACFVSMAKEWARFLGCKGNSTAIGFGILEYERLHGHLPPAHVDSPDGSRKHSWRALIADVWKASDFPYDFREPWNGPHNSKLDDDWCHRYFACPSDSETRLGPGLTNYFVVVGANTPFPGAHTTSYAKGKDYEGLDKTILMAEATEMGVKWLEPRDLDYDAMSFSLNDSQRPSISSSHPQGPNVCMADGSVRTLSQDISPEVLEAMLRVEKGAWRENAEPETANVEQVNVNLDEASAIAIAEVIFTKVYGKKVLKERPWNVTKEGSAFKIRGTLHGGEFMRGGVAEIEINQKTAEVRSIGHGK